MDSGLLHNDELVTPEPSPPDQASQQPAFLPMLCPGGDRSFTFQQYQSTDTPSGSQQPASLSRSQLQLVQQSSSGRSPRQLQQPSAYQHQSGSTFQQYQSTDTPSGSQHLKNYTGQGGGGSQLSVYKRTYSAVQQHHSGSDNFLPPKYSRIDGGSEHFQRSDIGGLSSSHDALDRRGSLGDGGGVPPTVNDAGLRMEIGQLSAPAATDATPSAPTTSNRSDIGGLSSSHDALDRSGSLGDGGGVPPTVNDAGLRMEIGQLSAPAATDATPSAPTTSNPSDIGGLSSSHDALDRRGSFESGGDVGPSTEVRMEYDCEVCAEKGTNYTPGEV